MFTKEDYFSYFEQIASIERIMVYRLNDTLRLINDQEIVRPLSIIEADERRHYSYIRNIFDTIFLKENEDKRNFERRHYLGNVRLELCEEADVMEGYCVNVSESGVCIEYSAAPLPFQAVKLHIDFFDGRQSLEREGHIVWSKIVPPDSQGDVMFSKSGINFDTLR